MIDQRARLAARFAPALRRRVEVAGADDEMRQRHIIGRYAIRFLSSLPEWQCDVVFGFDFAALVFMALWARALPAGDRFVAGFRRVSFAFDDDLIERRVDDRGESFLTLLANGVLMREMPRGANGLE